MIPEPADHCDDYIRDKSKPKCLRKFLLYKRIPATWQIRWTERGWPEPKLFATWKQPDGPGGRKGKTKRVRVVMASRFGDVGITKDLNRDHGYEDRVLVSQLTDFSEQP
jgi:hypothetical protein